jgi:hypothetical protein
MSPSYALLQKMPLRGPYVDGIELNSDVEAERAVSQVQPAHSFTSHSSFLLVYSREFCMVVLPV